MLEIVALSLVLFLINSVLVLVLLSSPSLPSACLVGVTFCAVRFMLLTKLVSTSSLPLPLPTRCAGQMNRNCSLYILLYTGAWKTRWKRRPGWKGRSGLLCFLYLLFARLFTNNSRTTYTLHTNISSSFSVAPTITFHFILFLFPFFWLFSCELPSLIFFSSTSLCVCMSSSHLRVFRSHCPWASIVETQDEENEMKRANYFKL